MTTETLHYIKPEQLHVGLYVHIDLGWMEHPFPFNNFKIKNESQIAEIRKLGLPQVRYDPLRSDCDPLPLQAPPIIAETPPPEPVVVEDEEAAKQAFHEKRLNELRQAIQECERKFSQASSTVRQIERDIQQNPPKTLDQAQELVDSMVDSLLTEGDVVLHAMQPKPGAVEHYTHALNVTVLSLMLAKSLEMTAENIRLLGLGSIFHDIGKVQIPDRITKKSDPLTKAELSLIHQHCAMGAKFANDVGMHTEVVRIILQHHECMDGTGYPSRLKESQIDRLARIVAVVNLYDNLCNPLNVAQAMTPYEALSHMFAHQRTKCDPAILKLLIKSLGVYPPGSLVRLSDNRHGIVVSVNPNKPLRPFVLLHAPDVPREIPLLVDLGEQASLSITHCLRPNQLPEDALEYLRPATRISYFFDKEKPEGH